MKLCCEYAHPNNRPAHSSLRHPTMSTYVCISKTDVDINEHVGSFILVTLGCDHGTLTLSPAAGLRFISGETSVWAGEVSFDGVASFSAGLSIANEALGGMSYRPNRDWNGNDTLTVAADDRGWSTEVSSTCVWPWCGCCWLL